MAANALDVRDVEAGDGDGHVDVGVSNEDGHVDAGGAEDTGDVEVDDAGERGDVGVGDADERGAEKDETDFARALPKRPMGVQSREPREGETVTITESDGYIVARDESSGVASQGDTKAEALANLAEALELHSRPDPDDAEVSEATAPWFSGE